jgi:AraC family transcriptional regulator of adaptative response / DNA-3-methyladenine glycosylase II
VNDDAYRRNVTAGGTVGWIEVGPPKTLRAGSQRDDTRLELRTDLPPSRELLRLVERVRDVLDLDTDTMQIGSVLSQDRQLAPLVRKYPGIRVPGAWDGFELAMRAILGQQVTVAGARTLAGRLVGRIGALTPERVADADLAALGVPGKRAETLRLLAKTVLNDGLSLDPWADPAETRAALLEIPGIGPWTVEYIAMRALRDPDAFPASDLGVRKALSPEGPPCSVREAERRAEAWRPWRSYAVMLLWRSL